MEPIVVTLLYVLAMYGMISGPNGIVLVAVSVVVAFFMSRDYFLPFLLSLGVIWGTQILIPEKATWAAVGLALAMLTMVITGAIGERKKKEEIPPEMIPYLMEMYGQQPPYGGGY